MHLFALLSGLVGLAMAFPSDRATFPQQVTLYTAEGTPLHALLFPTTLDQLAGNHADQPESTPDSSRLAPGFHRVRRSQQPGAPSPAGRTPGATNGGGGVNGGVERRPDGTHVSVDAQQNVYRSRDGNTEVNAHGRYERVYNGRGAGRPDYGAGVRVSHRW